MKQERTLKSNIVRIAAFSLPLAFAVWVLFAQGSRHSGLTPVSQQTAHRLAGEPQLLSIESIPAVEGEACLWEPASPPTPWLRRASANATMAGLLQQGEESSSAAVPMDKRPVESDRAPVRVIHDPNPSFSALAVEPASGMLVVADENLFQVLEYNRTDNTPPSAKMTEPKRVIGGNKTKAEMMCGVYIDPKTLDTYVVNNDTQNWMAVFSKNARGNVPPDRFLAVPHGTFGITVNENTQELFLSVQHDNSVVVYKKTASGNDKPLRVLAGDNTQLEDPHGITVDTKHNLLIVASHGNVSYRGNEVQPSAAAGEEGGGEAGGGTRYQPGSGKFGPPSIAIFSLDAQGNTAPLRRIVGPKTRLNWPAEITVDEERGDLYVANDMDQSITVFKVTDSGDVAPSRIIAGPKTEIRNPTGIALDLKNREMWIANMGNHTATAFHMDAEGNAAPIRTVRGGPRTEPSLMIGNPGGVAYDGKRAQILVPN